MATRSSSGLRTFRRARPSFLAAQFGTRSKPKPFTGVAIFDNPDQVNPLPAVDDLPGSALDAQMLALYVWLAAYRYRGIYSAVCVCLAESLSQAYVVAPPEFSPKETEPVSLDPAWQRTPCLDGVAKVQFYLGPTVRTCGHITSKNGTLQHDASENEKQRLSRRALLTRA